MKNRIHVNGIAWTFVVAAGWFGLWLLWPGTAGNAGTASRRAPPMTKFMFCPDGTAGASRSPTDMILPLPYGMGRATGGTGEDDKTLNPVRFDAARFLEERKSAVRPDDGSPPVPVFARLGRFEPIFPAPERPPAGTGTAATVRSDVQGALTNMNLRLPESAMDVLSRAGSSWTVKAWVEIGPDGMVEHAFLCEPSAKPEVNDSVLKMIYRGRGDRGTASASGYVRLWMP